MNKDRLGLFIEADKRVRDLEQQLLMWKSEKAKLSESILDTFGLEGISRAEHDGYVVRTHRNTYLRVIDRDAAEAAMLDLGLEDFVKTEIDVARLATWCRKNREYKPEAWLGMEWQDSYSLRVVEKK